MTEEDLERLRAWAAGEPDAATPTPEANPESVSSDKREADTAPPTAPCGLRTLLSAMSLTLTGDAADVAQAISAALTGMGVVDVTISISKKEETL